MTLQKWFASIASAVMARTNDRMSTRCTAITVLNEEMTFPWIARFLYRGYFQLALAQNTFEMCSLQAGSR